MIPISLTVRTLAAPLAFFFGAMTAAGDIASGVDVGVAGLTINGGNSAGHWQASSPGSRTILTPSSFGDSQDLSAGTYTLTMSNGQQVNIMVVSGLTVGNLTDMRTALNAGFPLGSSIFLRQGGNYSVVPGDITPVLTGTWVSPSNFVPYHRGVNLNTGNHTMITKHLGESVTIGCRMTFTGGNGRIRFAGLEFKIQDTIKSSMILMDNLQGWAFDTCRFIALAQANDSNRRSGIAISGVITDMTIQNCYFEAVSTAFTYAGARATIVGNTVRWATGDIMNGALADDQRFCWNFFYDYRRPSDLTGVHADAFQGNTAGALTNPSRILVLGNIMARGDLAALLSGKQCHFWGDLGLTLYLVDICIVGNRYITDYTHGITVNEETFTRPDPIQNIRPFVCWNTVLHSDVKAPGGAFIKIGGAQDMVQHSNIVAGATLPANLEVSSAAGYVGLMVGGNSVKGACGTTLAEVVEATNIVPGSAADLGNYGANQRFVNYIDRTTAFPGSLPSWVPA